LETNIHKTTGLNINQWNGSYKMECFDDFIFLRGIFHYISNSFEKLFI
jgi:hypothetical protein